MITINLTSEDLEKMRFAYRPLIDIPMSYRVWKNPALHAPHRRWIEETHYALHDVDLTYLDALVTAGGCYIPNFLSPPPTTRHIELEDDLAALLETPDAVVRRDMQQMIRVNGDSEIRRFFMTYPREALACLADDLRLYWQHALARYWSRMVMLIEGDVVARGRTLAMEGAKRMFEDLHTSISYQAHSIQIKRTCQCVHSHFQVDLAGEGLQLVPTVFAPMCMYQIAPDSRPMLIFGVNGTGLWLQSSSRQRQSLELALGAGRASVLQILRTPASNGEVAYKARITASTASQHLMRLTKAGLVESHRSGKRVYYSLTQRGEHLLALFDSAD